MSTVSVTPIRTTRSAPAATKVEVTEQTSSTGKTILVAGGAAVVSVGAMAGLAVWIMNKKREKRQAAIRAKAELLKDILGSIMVPLGVDKPIRDQVYKFIDVLYSAIGAEEPQEQSRIFQEGIKACFDKEMLQFVGRFTGKRRSDAQVPPPPTLEQKA